MAGQGATWSAEANHLFDKARSDFLATLTTQERDQYSACNSPDELLSDIKGPNHRGSLRRSLPILRRIQSFSEHLSPYFQIIEIVCQSNPEWSCIAWGAFRLVLQLASNFVTFFEKLSKLIERLTVTLPQFAEFYETICSGGHHVSSRVSNSLVRFYVDIFEFFQAIARVFTKPNGKLKRSPVVIADLLWKPFDLRFQNILERMAVHQGILKDHLQWTGMEHMKSAFETEAKRAEDARASLRSYTDSAKTSQDNLSEQAQRAFRASVVAWLSPPPFKGNFEKAQDSREDGTAEWLFDEPQYETWMNSDVGTSPRTNCLSDAVLWIRGNPGWGKTVLAASTVDELELQQSTSKGEAIVCYYFFSQQDSNQDSSALTSAYRAIATQIFQKCHKMENIHNIYALANDGSRSLASEHELRDLLGMVLFLLSNLYLVLDGIDECAETEQLISSVRQFCSTSSVKAILFSRPHVAALRHSVSPTQIITLSRDVLSRDIIVFLRHEIGLLRNKNRFPSNFDLVSIENTIAERADGMFLWARLMICYLDSPALTKQERITTVFETSPVGLQEMYRRIFGQIKRMDDASQRLAASVFNWVAHAQDDLTADECSEALYPGSGPDDEPEKQQYVDHAIIVVCSGLIEKRHDNTLRFIHLTAKEYVSTTGNGDKDLCILPPWEAHVEITHKCLSYLMFSIPAQPLSGKLSAEASSTKLCNQYPLLQYATKHWISHLRDSLTALQNSDPTPAGIERFSRVVELLGSFLKFPLTITAWIEAVCLFTREPPTDLFKAVADLLRSSVETWLDPVFTLTAKEFSSFTVELQGIKGDWEVTLKKSPHKIWGDISAFNSSRFLAKNPGVSLQKFPSSKRDIPTKCNEPIFCISATNSESSLIGKLTIWPSPAFHKLWHDKPKSYNEDWHQKYSEDESKQRKYCEGWFAHYEIWTLGQESEKAGSCSFPIAPEEIALQIRFSFRLSPVRTWKLKFPLAIGPNLCTVAVLRTVVTFPSCFRESRQLQCFSVVPSSDRIQAIYRSWIRKKFSPHLPYTYEWVFSPESRFAIFRDWDKESSQSSFAVFELVQNALDLRAYLISHQEYNRPMSEQGLGLCEVHPAEPKVLLLNKDKLHFIDLDSGDSVFTSLSQPHTIEKLEFSHCGKYYILYRNSRRPEFFALPYDSSSAGASKDENYQERQLSKRPKLEHPIAEQLGAVFKSSGSGDTMTCSSSYVDPHTKTMIGIIPRYDGLTGRIELLSQYFDQKERSRCTLVEVPEKTDARTIKTTIQVLDEGQRLLRMVLNPTSSSVYESDIPTVSKHLPVVVDRDLATIPSSSENPQQQLQHQLLPRMRLNRNTSRK